MDEIKKLEDRIKDMQTGTEKSLADLKMERSMVAELKQKLEESNGLIAKQRDEMN